MDEELRPAAEEVVEATNASVGAVEDVAAEAKAASGPLATAEHAAKAAGKVAAAAVLATSLTAVLSEPPRTELITLPEPTPIVQIYNPYVDDVEPEETEEDDAESNRWRRILKLLRMLAVALLIAASLAFGLLKGCASCSAGFLLPPDDPPQEEQADEQARSSEPDAELPAAA